MPFRHIPFQRWSLRTHCLLAGLLVAVVCLGGWQWLHKEHAALLELENEHANLKAQLSAVPAPAVATANFAQTLPAAARADDVSRDVAQFANTFGVRVVSMAIDTQAATTTELGRVNFNISAQADYKGAKAWLAELLGRYSSLGIQSLAIRANPSDTTRQDVRVAMVLYVKD